MPLMQQTYTSHPPDAVGIGIMRIAALIGLVVFFAILAVLCYFIAEHYKIIPAGARKMEPGQVWLLLIPLFNLYWVFPVFLGLSESYQAAFAARGRTDLGACGRHLALWFCICFASSVIPCLQYATGLAALVLLILYIIRISDYKKQLIAT